MFLFGKQGTGKSFTINKICQFYHKRNKECQFFYVSSLSFAGKNDTLDDGIKHADMKTKDGIPLWQFYDQNDLKGDENFFHQFHKMIH